MELANGHRNLKNSSLLASSSSLWAQPWPSSVNRGSTCTSSVLSTTFIQIKRPSYQSTNSQMMKARRDLSSHYCGNSNNDFVESPKTSPNIMVHPCCEYPLQSCVSYLALYDLIWSFIRTIYHLNELLTTFDAWVAAGRIPDYGPISSSFDGFLVVVYVTYFGLSICMIVGAHTQSSKKLSIWVLLASLVIILQLFVFQISLIVGHFSEWSLEFPPETFYTEYDRELRILKIPTQGICCIGCFYTVYEIWVVKLFIEELESESVSESDDPLHRSIHRHV